MVEAVIFDMDGVIVDSEPVYMNRLVQYLSQRDCIFDLIDLNKIVGSSTKETWEYVATLFKEPKEVETVIEDYAAYASSLPKINYRDILNKGFIEVAEYLKSKNISIALASSSPLKNIEQVLKECNIRDYFSVIISGEQFENSKPDPSIYNHSAKALGISKDHIIAIEDSTYGILAAKRAGIFCLAKKDDRYNFEQNLADACVENLIDIIQYIR